VAYLLQGLEYCEFKWDKEDNRNQTCGRICLTDMIFLNYGDSQAESICVEFEYFPSDSSINYLDICYSDPALERYLEGNPFVLKNIDAYIRNKLLKQESIIILFKNTYDTL
jgi:hypothetical protein